MGRLGQMAEGYSNLVKSAVGTADSKVETMASTRFDICKACDKLTIASTCQLCGCFMPSKTRSTTAKCPDNKW